MRNTAPCIAYVSWKIQKEDPEAVFAVVPSDHLVLKVDDFQSTMTNGFNFVSKGDRILTLGMQPSRPETGYGYIEQGNPEGNGVYKLKSFRVKPDLKTAISYLQQGGFTWNRGMFLWSVGTIVSELRKHTPEIAAIMDEIEPVMFTDQEQINVNKLFPDCTKISIDYAVMEKTDKSDVLPTEFGWSDLGTWGSLHTVSEQDENQNAVIGNIIKSNWWKHLAVWSECHRISKS